MEDINDAGVSSKSATILRLSCEMSLLLCPRTTVGIICFFIVIIRDWQHLDALVGNWSPEARRGFHRRRFQPVGAVHDVVCDWENREEDKITQT